MVHSTKTLWHNHEDSWLQSEELPEDDSLVMVDSMYSLVSLGTERLLISRNLSQDLDQKMRVPYMRGHFNSSFTYGYSLVGVVHSKSSTLNNKLVHLMHPHQDKVLVKEEDLFLVPESMNPQLATLASNMETAVNALWDARVEIGDKILIVGYGTIGALIAAICQTIHGVTVIVYDVDDSKRSVIENVGLSLWNQNPRGEPADSFDFVFNTSSSELALQMGLDLVRDDGTVIELSWYGAGSISLNLGGSFHYGRKKIISSQVSRIPHRKQPEWDYRKRKQLCFELLSTLDLDHLIQEEINFDKTPSFYESLRGGNVDKLGVVIKY